MLSTPCSCCSMGVATDCSRVSASAPTLLRRWFGFGHRFERLRIDRHARLHPLGPLGDNLLARLQPLLNDPFGAHSLTDFNRSDANLVIVADYGHLVTA